MYFEILFFKICTLIKNICCQVAKVFRKWIDLGHVGLKFRKGVDLAAWALRTSRTRGSGPSGAPKNCPERTKKCRKSTILGYFRLKSDHLVTFGLKKSGNWLIRKRRESFGVEDSIFRLDEEVEEGVDVANESSEKRKKC
jgi:hypothetical protein